MDVSLKIKNHRICWECEARKRGFKKAKEMFNYLYSYKHLSTRKLGDMFDYSWYGIYKWLIYYKIPIRKN